MRWRRAWRRRRGNEKTAGEDTGGETILVEVNGLGQTKQGNEERRGTVKGGKEEEEEGLRKKDRIKEGKVYQRDDTREERDHEGENEEEEDPGEEREG